MEWANAFIFPRMVLVPFRPANSAGEPVQPDVTTEWKEMWVGEL